MSNKAYITLLSTNNYLYGCIGLMYSWKATNPKYPFYCIVTEDITEYNIQILEAIGYKIFRENRYIPTSYLEKLKKYEETGIYETPIGESSSDLQRNGWQHGWTKLHIFKYEQFDKLLYIDADSYIVQNLDDVFDRPAWSAVSEYDATWRGYHRFMSAFLLIKPNLDVYNEILQLAEDNPLIIHPQTNEYQLSNDYDLLNLYKNDWGKHPELSMPNYTYIDSFVLQTSEFFYPFLISSLYKVKAIHLTGTKPWLQPVQEVINYGGEWGLWKELYLLYIRFLNKALEDLCHKGIANLCLVE